jgi:predicted amidohydrolase YtcJ
MPITNSRTIRTPFMPPQRGCGQRGYVQAVILENGVIRTMDAALPTARALAIAGDRIAGGVGVHEAALASPDVVDLGGRCVLPGFNDAHVHFPSWSLAQQQVRLENARSLDEALERVAAAVGEVQPGRWLRGLGWRSGDWSPTVEPTKEALDAVTGDVPTALMARDYHSLWLNSAALARADGDLEAHAGVVERDEHGEPTGVLREECAWHFRDSYSRPTEDEMVEASREGIRLAVSRGVTAVHDKDGWLGALGVFQRLRDEGSLLLRVWQSIPHAQVGEAAALGVRSGFGDDLLRLGYLKAFMDGTLGSQTARMLDGSGVEITSRAELEEIVRRGAEARLPVAVHAIGDLANREALDAFEATRELWQPLGLRPRIEHAQLLAPGDIGRFAELGVAASVQFSHAPSDRDIADRFWAGKTDGAYAYRSLLESSALVANGSDAPIEELDPWAGICAGVLRTIDDRPAWHPEQRVTLEEALLATTVNPSWLAGDERRRGKLVPGYLADLVVLDRDPFELEPEDMPELEVVATMVGGRWVYNPPPW